MGWGGEEKNNLQFSIADFIIKDSENGNENKKGDSVVVKQIAQSFVSGLIDFSVKKLGYGDNSVIYLLEGVQKLVVKLSKPRYEYKALSDYKKEKWCLLNAHRLNIPSPELFEIGKYGLRPYMIQSYIEGQPVALLDDSSSFLGEDKLKVWRKLGEYTRKINSIPVVGWGENLVDEKGVFSGSWEKHVQYNIDSLNEKDALLKMGVLIEKQSKDIKKVFNLLLDKKFNFGLCHGDIALRNTMLGSDGKVYLLDWGSARAEIVPHFELNEIIRASKPDKETLTTFLGGYGISSEAFEEMDPDLSVLNLLNEIDTLRWAIEKMPTRVRDKIGRVEEAITRFEEDK